MHPQSIESEDHASIKGWVNKIASILNAGEVTCPSCQVCQVTLTYLAEVGES